MSSTTFSILGALRVHHDGVDVPIAGGRQRAALALLLLEHPNPVPDHLLVDNLWEFHPPATAREQLRNTMARLRQALPADSPRPVRDATGYRLMPPQLDLDSHHFIALIEAKAYRQALELWRGSTLAGLDTPAIRAAAARFQEMYLSAWEGAIQAGLDAGRHDELIPDAAALVQSNPLREHLVGQLALAQFRAQRTPEALATLREHRRLLRDEHGLDPGPAITEMEQAILRDDSALRGPTSSPVPLRRFLPRDVTGFVGREAELAWLDSTAAGTGAGVTLISSVAGLGGIGKTALAVHWAHRNVAKYPDGQLFVNLRGFDQRGPMSLSTALASILKALGVPAESIPTDPEDAAALYRSEAAERRLLIVFDDARSPDQVRPLLPTGAGSHAIVTSREALTGLVARDGARQLVMRPLLDEDAAVLLDHIVGAQRVSRESGAALELAELCGNLPLALRIAAANLLANPQQPIAEMASSLRQSDRIGQLSVTGDTSTAIQAVFDQSYAALNSVDQIVLALLSLNPGTDITAEATAALSSMATEDAQISLQRLTRASLVMEPSEGRYQLHDLVKLFATSIVEQQVSEDGRDRARAGLFGFYLDRAASAAVVVAPHLAILTSVPPRHANATSAMDWLQSEQDNLIAVIRYAADHGNVQDAWRLADAMRGYFWVRHDLGDWMDTARIGMAAAVSDGNDAAQAAMHSSLANASRLGGQRDEAIFHFGESIRLSRQGKWPLGEASALGGLGTVHMERGDMQAAIGVFEMAMEVNQQHGNTAALAVNRANIGSLRVYLGEFRAAARDLAEGLALFQATGNRVVEAITLCNLGLVRLDLGEYAEAENLFHAAISIHQDFADLSGETVASLGLSEACLRTERLDEAAIHIGRAINLAETINSARHKAIGLVALAHLHRLNGNLDDAFEVAGQALRGAREISMRFIENDALDVLAQIKYGQGNHVAAQEDALMALSIAEADGYQVMTVKVLTTLAEISLAMGDVAQAISAASRAMEICERTGIQQCAVRLDDVLKSSL